VGVDFAGLRAVDDVSFRVQSNEIVGLIGPNGAGKTTLVNVVSGFQPPTRGRVELNGTDVTARSVQWRSRHGMVRTFQGSRPFASMTVSENVEVSGVGHGLSRRAARTRAADTLADLGLSVLAGRRAAELTTGQERRLQVARALAMRPQFLLLDEPAAGLNESESDTLLELIQELPGRYGCGVILIEHDMRLVMSACTRLIVLNYGRLLADDTPDIVRQDPEVIGAYLGTSHA
jgi:ABC-type branched-subunit amino acid transport system ATPase component